jgi:DNA-binding MarR family transcriptional regulator
MGMTSSIPAGDKPKPCPEESLYVDLLRTADVLSRGPAQLLRERDLTANQYNVLRILRGAREGLLCGEIGARMITRDPDLTRLLNRLEKRRLIGRKRPDQDRRRVMVRIAAEGLRLLRSLDEPICELHRRQLGHLGRARLEELGDLLLTCRGRVG